MVVPHIINSSGRGIVRHLTAGTSAIKIVISYLLARSSGWTLSRLNPGIEMVGFLIPALAGQFFFEGESV
jgi:hypothetical protein